MNKCATYILPLIVTLASCSLNTKQHVDFRVSGIVLDATTKKGIENIQVNLKSANIGTFCQLLTDASGNFSVEGLDGGYDLGDTLWIIATDIDSTRSVKYATDTICTLFNQEVDDSFDKSITSTAENICIYLQSTNQQILASSNSKAKYQLCTKLHSPSYQVRINLAKPTTLLPTSFASDSLLIRS